MTEKLFYSQRMKAVIKILKQLYPRMGFELVGQG